MPHETPIVHQSELDYLRQVFPEYPAEALASNVGDQRCIAKLSFGTATGMVVGVEIHRCPRCSAPSASGHCASGWSNPRAPWPPTAPSARRSA